MKITLPKEWYESKLPDEEGHEIGAGCPAAPLFGFLALSVMGANEPPVSREAHGPGSVKRWKVTLVDRMRFTRRPRSKKRRIIKKWRKRPENWTPNMLPIATYLMIGSMATARGYGVKTESKSDPYWNEEDPSRPRWLEMHTLLWEKVKREQPEFANKCDVFRRQTVIKSGIQWTEDVPLSQSTEHINSHPDKMP